MAETPEQRERERLVYRLRVMADALKNGQGIGEETSPGTLGVILSQSANEIEHLGKQLDHIKETLNV